MSNAINTENAKAAKNGAAAAPELITDLTIGSLRDFVQQAGYRVETIGEGEQTFLRSATNGLAFDIRLGNGFAGMSEHHADIAFVTFFTVRGVLPLELINRWNRTRRFGRLLLDQPVPGQDFLVFCMDVSVAGGVSSQQLRAQIDIWDSLVQQLVPWLREELGKLAPGAEPAASPAEAKAPALSPDAATPRDVVVQ